MTASAIKRYEARLITDALRETRGNVAAASEILEVPLRTLWRRLEEYEIDPGRWRPRKRKP